MSSFGTHTRSFFSPVLNVPMRSQALVNFYNHWYKSISKLTKISWRDGGLVILEWKYSKRVQTKMSAVKFHSELGSLVVYEKV